MIRMQVRSLRHLNKQNSRLKYFWSSHRSFYNYEFEMPEIFVSRFNLKYETCIHTEIHQEANIG